MPRSPGRPPPGHWSSVHDSVVFGLEGVTPDLAPGLQYDIVCAADVLYFHDQVPCSD